MLLIPSRRGAAASPFAFDSGGDVVRRPVRYSGGIGIARAYFGHEAERREEQALEEGLEALVVSRKKKASSTGTGLT